MRTLVPSSSHLKPRGLARWWRFLLDAVVAVAFFASIPAYGVGGFVMGFGFTLSAMEGWARARRGFLFADPRNQLRLALRALPFNALLLGSVIAWIINAAAPDFWLVMGVLIAITGAATAHFTLTHPLTWDRPTRKGDDREG